MNTKNKEDWVMRKENSMSRILSLAIVLAMIGVALISSGPAYVSVTAADAQRPPVANFTYSPEDLLGLASPEVMGANTSDFSLLWKHEYFEQINMMAVADLDEDGNPEIIAGSEAGVFVLNYDGSFRWGDRTFTGVERIFVEDIDGDSQKEIIGSTWLEVFALESNGSIKWSEHLSFWGLSFSFNPLPLAVADIDNDLKKEVVTGFSGSEGNRVLTFEAENGALKWAVPLSESGTIHKENLAVGDIDGDGKKEVLVAPSAGGFTKVIVLNGTDGTKKQEYSVSQEPNEACEALNVGDINGDGMDEIVVGLTKSLVALNGEGSILWSTPTSYPVRFITLGDVNSDGRKEVIAATNDKGWLSLFPNHGIVYVLSGGGKLLWTYDSARNEVFSILVADVDDDGQNEVVLAAGYDAVVLSDSGGSEWSFTIPGRLEDAPFRVRTAAAADVDNDGSTELLVGAVNVYLLEAGGSIDWSFENGFTVSRIVSGDINGDGLDEVVAGDEYKLYVYDRYGTLLWSKVSKASFKRCLALSDLNEDGKKEVIATAWNKLQVYQGDGSLLWEYEVERPLTIEALGVGNVDDDPQPEIVFAGFNYVMALEPDGSVKWTKNYEMLGHTNSALVGDIDDDGANEVVVGGGGTLAFEGDGSELWDTAWNEYVEYDSLSIGDIDDDGANDVVLGTSSGRVKAIKGKDGSELWTYNASGAVHVTAVADIDNDDQNEVILTAGGSGEVSVLEPGYPKPTLKWSYHSPDDYTFGSLRVADIDRDGLSEILASTTDLFVLQNNGSLKWSYDPGRLFISGSYTCPIAIGNLNNNGIADIILGALGIHALEAAYATPTQPPIASFTYSPKNPSVNEQITFDASGSHDPDGYVKKYEWSFGDGNTGLGEKIVHSYSRPGNYTVTLRVRDNDGAVNSTTKVVSVKELPGDVNGDGKVDATDLTLIGAAFGSVQESPNWNPAADVDKDGIVDIFDLVLSGKNFGKAVGGEKKI